MKVFWKILKWLLVLLLLAGLGYLIYYLCQQGVEAFVAWFSDGVRKIFEALKEGIKWA